MMKNSLVSFLRQHKLSNSLFYIEGHIIELTQAQSNLIYRPNGLINKHRNANKIMCSVLQTIIPEKSRILRLYL